MKVRCEKDCESVILLACTIHTFSQCHDKKNGRSNSNRGKKELKMHEGKKR